MSEPSSGSSKRTIEVDMSSEAIARRMREASEFNKLGRSLAKAKPCPPQSDARTDEFSEKSSRE